MRKALSEMSLEELWELFPIILKEHNPAYKEWYAFEENELFNVVGKRNIMRINHIGSSSVAGLIAKPTVDILLEMKKDCNLEQLKSELTKSGWLCMSYEDKPDFKMILNKGYTPEGFAEKVFHLHVRYFGDWDELYFRDFLIDHCDIAEKYGELKKTLINRYLHNRDGYTEAKTDFIMKYTSKAREEYGNRYLYK